MYYEAGKVLIRVDAEASTPDSLTTSGYTPPIHKLFVDLTRLCGLSRLELEWPLGLPLVSGVALRPTPDVSEARLRQIIALSRPISRWPIPKNGWSANLRSAARLRIVATVDPGKVSTAVDIATRTPGVRFAEPIPVRVGPQFSDRPDLKVAACDFSNVNTWWRNAIASPANWDSYPLKSIAILDSGCDVTHPTFGGRVTPADSYSSNSSKSDHATFICGQLIGNKCSQSGFADLPDRYGLFPRGSLWLMSVENLDVPSSTFRIHNGVYTFALWLLGQGDAATRTNFLLDSFSIKVLNLSLGNDDARVAGEATTVGDRSWGPTSSSKNEEDLINAVVASGITVVACAHNKIYGNSQSTKVKYPAAFSNVISVGALDKDSKLWPDSRTDVPDNGPKSPAVDICAPGVEIWSSSPQTSSDIKFIRCWQGTSFAAPYVTAAAAVLYRLNPAATPADIRSAIMNVHRQPPVEIKDGYGKGLLNCAAIKPGIQIFHGGHRVIDTPVEQIGIGSKLPSK